MRDINLLSLTSNLGFKIIGAAAGDQAGYSVSSAGDINGDGFDDIIVGAPGISGGGNTGIVYIIYGKNDGLVDIDLANFTLQQGFKIIGASDDGIGGSVSAGDINGDGFSDIIIGAPQTVNPSRTGDAYVIYGKSGRLIDIDLLSFQTTQEHTIIGSGYSPAVSHRYIGRSVTTGDINGDGFNDILVSATSNYQQSSRETIYGIYGNLSMPIHIDLANDFTGFMISRTSAGSVGGVVDINGDGFNDIIIGDASSRVAAYVVYGKSGGLLNNVNLATLTTAQGFKILGAASTSVSGAGDINGDGFGDAIISAPSAGIVYVIYGKTRWLRSVDLAQFTAAQGFKIIGATDNDSIGSSISSGGDINGDGLDDIIIGARTSSPGGKSFAGSAYVVYGRNDELGDIDLANLTVAQGFKILGAAERDMVGTAVSSAGDINGDGLNDIIISGSRIRGFAGCAYVIYGKKTIIGTVGNDVIFPGVKPEYADGLAGIDTINYSHSNSSIIVNLATNIGSGGAAEGDIIFNFENIIGSNYADVLTGDDNANDIQGGAGGDIQDGGAGNDTVSYRSSVEGVTINLQTNSTSGGDAEGDTILNFENVVGSSHADILVGDAGNNDIQGGAGSDTLDGGSGIDTVNYINSISGVIINLTTNIASGGDAEGDIISNFENVIGSSHDDVLTGDTNANDIKGGTGNDIIEGKAGADTLDGGIGFDIVSYAGSVAGVIINLASGTGMGGDATGDVISNFENIIGSVYSDTLVGDAGNNNIQGGPGADILDGGPGIDTVSYTNSAVGIAISLASGTGTRGDATGDSISNFENIIGSGYADTLVGDAASNNIQGAAGDDLIEGGAGADVLEGGVGIDTLSYAESTIGVTVKLAANSVSGGDAAGDIISSFENLLGSRETDALSGDANPNTIQGGSGDDTIEGGAGSDILDGGTGIDTLSYSNSTEAVTVNLATNTAAGGDATGDIISNFENILGSKQADSLSGDTGINTIQGNASDDVIEGKEGADVLNGGSGTDTVSYLHSTSGVTVSLETGTGIGGDAEGDVISGFENLLGSDFPDRLTGDANNNNIQGGSGDDIIEGKAGSDTLDGGIGKDTISYASSKTGVTVSLASGIGLGGDAAGDVISNFENLIGSNYADILIGDAGDNDIKGGASDDILKDGGGGNDIFTGGLEADSFVISSSKGTVTITDFNDAEDKLDLDRFDISFTQVINSARNKDNDCEIILGRKKIILLNQDKNNIQKSWFSSLAAESPTAQLTTRTGLTKQDVAKLVGSVISTTITVGSFVAKSYQYYKPGILGHDKFYSFASSMVPKIIMKTTANIVRAAENSIKAVVNLKAQYEQIDSDLVYDQLQKALLKAEQTCRTAASTSQAIQEAAQKLLLTAQGKSADAAQVTLKTATSAFDFYTRHYHEYSKELQHDSSDGEGVELEALGLI